MNVTVDSSHVMMHDTKQGIHFWRPHTERDLDEALLQPKQFEARMKKQCYGYRTRYRNVK